MMKNKKTCVVVRLTATTSCYSERRKVFGRHRNAIVDDKGKEPCVTRSIPKPTMALCLIFTWIVHHTTGGCHHVMMGSVKAYSCVATTTSARHRVPPIHRRRCRTIRRSTSANNDNDASNDNENDSSNEIECDAGDRECLFDEMEIETDPIRKQQIKMTLVRSIQNSFYAAPPSMAVKAHDDWDDNNSNKNTNDGGDDDDDFITRPIFHGPSWDNGGTIEHLPLWRVPWIEVIGRTNVLFVHDAIYTNMFEELIRRHHVMDSKDTTNRPERSQPVLFGHVYIPPGGSQQLRSDNIRYKLQSWTDYVSHPQQQRRRRQLVRPNRALDDASVIGTVMKINDYRRMNDGKLILYVQSIERFIVTHVHQTVPYGIVNVQLLPDQEELMSDSSDDSLSSLVTMNSIRATSAATEDMIRPLRTRAIVNESWSKWFPYEYSNRVGLPIPPPPPQQNDDNDNQQNDNAVIPSTALSMSDIVGCALAKVVPFAPFDPQRLPMTSKVIEESPLTSIDEHQASLDGKKSIVVSIESSTPPIEEQLLQSGILIDDDDATLSAPYSVASIESVDELERRLWITLNLYYMKSNTAISPFILSMLPPSGTVVWPKGFLLEGIANVMERSTRLTSLAGTVKSNVTDTSTTPMARTTTTATAATATEFVRVPITYPSLRRQKRCSYYVAQILESFDLDNVQLLRCTLLRMPSTKQRLAYVLSCLETEVNTLTTK